MQAATECLIASCADEPIRTPGSIQPHGILLILSKPDLVCMQASANAADWLGVSLEQMVGAPLREVAPAAAGTLSGILRAGEPGTSSPFSISTACGLLDAHLHWNDAGWILECERAGPPVDARWYAVVAAAVSRLRKAADCEALAEVLAAEVAWITGFDRVMVYKFDEDWHGSVVAERRAEKLESYLGHHFPESDIPAQARELYSHCALRVIPDAGYTPVEIVPGESPVTGKAVDLGCAMLRSVSPVHLEYLQNMGVGASMSVSLMPGDRLWGLVACHHRTPRPIPVALRAACELIGRVASLEIAMREENRRLSEYAQAARVQTRFFDVIAGEQNVVEALVKYTPRLMEFLGACGAAIHIAGCTTLIGRTPSGEEVAGIVHWLGEMGAGAVYSTKALSRRYPAAAAFAASASGLLAARLSRVEPHYVLWFRPELVSTITWAGRPDKAMDVLGKLHPRRSFDAWHETVRGQSRPWGDAEREAARELVHAINALVLRRTERLLTLNAELERKNIDLNSFAYIAAHDLKEPLRGISSYCSFLYEDHSQELSEEALRKLETISGLAAHSAELIDALNHYSKIGRLELNRKPAPLDGIVDAVLAALELPLRENRVEVRRPVRLPVVSCDAVLVREVFQNLIANAIRYTDKPVRWVEIGIEHSEGGDVFYVRDNGIGIRERHFDDIFHIFRRLHAHSEYGGGTGAGLAIVRSIVERHGGRVWVESTPGQGSTFRFTLA